jgi:hypothetical protein
MKRNNQARSAVAAVLGCGAAAALWSSEAWAAPVLYHDEASLLAAVGPGGALREGFEDDTVWGALRTPLFGEPHAAAVVAHGTLLFRSNHPSATPPSLITTSQGAAYEGQWALHAWPHGNPEAAGEQTPLRDGLELQSAVALRAAGGWFMGTHGGSLLLVVDGNESSALEAGPLDSSHRFYGVVVPERFYRIEFRETEGTVGDPKFLFVDYLALAAADDVPAWDAGPVADAASPVAEAGSEPDGGVEGASDAVSPEVQGDAPEGAGEETGSAEAAPAPLKDATTWDQQETSVQPEMAPAPDAAQEAGCGCRAAGERSAAGSWLLTACLLGVWNVRRTSARRRSS